MRGVDGEHVGTGFHEFGGPLQIVARGADSAAHAQPALLVLAGVGILELLLDVLYGDQALELILVVDDEELFDTVLVEDELGFLKRGADGDGDEVFLGHHVANGNVAAGFKAEVAVGEDADQLFAARNGHAGNLIAAHHFEGVGDELIGPDGDGVDNHAALRALHLVDLAGLVNNGEITMHDADAALLRHGNGHARLGDGIHGRGEQRSVERNSACELGLRAHLRGHDVAVGRNQQHIVEGQGFRQSFL